MPPIGAFHRIAGAVLFGLAVGLFRVQIAAIDTTAALLVPLVLLEQARWLPGYLGSVAVGSVGFLVLATVEALIRVVLFAAA
jgi:hypothetical protein